MKIENFKMDLLSVDVFSGPAGSCGFRTGNWPFQYNGQNYQVYASVPHAQSFDDQKDDVTKSAIRYLRKLKIIK